MQSPRPTPYQGRSALRCAVQGVRLIAQMRKLYQRNGHYPARLIAFPRSTAVETTLNNPFFDSYYHFQGFETNLPVLFGCENRR